MQNKLFQEMVFDIKDYHWQNTIEEARTAMWKDIGTFLSIILKCGNIAVVRDDDTDIIVIEYEHDNHNDYWGTPNPKWLSEDEQSLIDKNREDFTFIPIPE